jgi:excisionase family DNA binding protein
MDEPASPGPVASVVAAPSNVGPLLHIRHVWCAFPGPKKAMTAKKHKMSTTADRPLESTILTIDQAAAYLAIPKATLYTWRTRRAGFGPPATKIGGCLRYRRCDLDAWIARHVETFGDPDDGVELTPVSVPSPRDGVSLSRTSSPRDHRI